MPGALLAAADGVALRTFEREDVPFVQRANANPELRVPIGSAPKRQDELEEWLLDGETDRFVVCRADDPAPGQPEDPDRIGAVSIEGADWRRPELGYWLVSATQGQGHGHDRTAVSLTIDWAFETYGHPAVEAAAYDFNEASRGLLESLGFEEEGRLRKRRFVGGEYVDTIQYGLLREDWRSGDR